MRKLIFFAVIAAAVFQGYVTTEGRLPALVDAPAPTPPRGGRAEVARATPKMCDGRTRCAQLHSCEEAIYFLKNCPGVKLDDDGDGVPCEAMLCR